ncbi:acetyl/propionyl/methylcrotonyl-CoA carboxylase subunit alpha [Paraneptunicella aestuarii]|uniref:acetyl/propionyl/methylcrotonyl-CoA carboxylase subunit alpha n=1 Tax=Paraneptunicella aestuarii TaxID=2831148 RepID=UPI001E30659D|nr:acetyl/propionyl/methylcrotonyl-CoA carboxylase subunit alpha [Paraneptunicella aestuarii]UAA40252.1 acetyl/propionyl/methylcrotonyl-CoA carboxylase subunit alpha [Paraneptunicella aestuarii]
MFKKLLIANRGEIACRVIRTAKQMGIATVAVYSDADAHALHVQHADEAVHIGGSAAKESYLLGNKIIEVAKSLGVDAIHPGYGFLSENADFANLCQANNITFVGPPVGAIEAMGSKSAAKKIMQEANVPLVPGYHGDDQAPATLKKHADDMGYPVLLKAAAGGGGKGMRQVWSANEFESALEAAKREAMNGFGDDHMLVEKYLTQPRHVEIQVFCDQQGNGVYLFERDCSVQRRHQKVIEEAPAPGMTEELRKQMGEAALLAAKAINYVGAGTVEFLLDSDGSFYFMEMNTRLQVEHPVTEMITGQDLVSWQLRVAHGEPLPLQQEELSINGHAFEARVYAEDPNNEFLPATGKLTYLQPPVENRHVRVDTGVLQGDEVSVYYDPMIAKLIVWDENRDKALTRLTKALSEYRIKGLVNNIPFLYNLASTSAFRNAELDTGFIDKHHDAIFVEQSKDIEKYLPMMAVALILDKQKQAENLIANHNNDPFSPWQLSNAWRANETHEQTLSLDVSGEIYTVSLMQLEDNASRNTAGRRFVVKAGEKTSQISAQIENDLLQLNIDGHRQTVTIANDDIGISLYTNELVIHFAEHKPDLGLDEDNEGNAGFTAPMNGTVVKLMVETNAIVEKGQPLMIMEAMKMEHALTAPATGKVTEFFYQVGDLVDGGAELLAFEAEEE